MEAARADVLLLYDAADAPHWSEVGDVAGLMRTVVITERPSQADALLAIERGVDGYLEAGLPGSALRRALAGVFGGELAYKRETIGAWLRTRRPSTRQPVLTHRQAQILELIAEGATDKEIAARIGIRTATAQKHVARLLRRLNVRNRAAAVASRRLRSGRSKP